MQAPVQGLEAWVARLGEVDIPVLTQTADDLALLRANQKNLDPRRVCQVVARDPLMAVKVLRHFNRQRRNREFTETALIERAVIMMGMEAFFNSLPAEPLVEDVLHDRDDALTMLRRAINRAYRASRYAGDWAVLLHDLHLDEIRTVASLHDFADMLLWCFAPAQMLEMRDAQREDRSLRSRDAQEQVFGFAFVDLQVTLAAQWGLPGLLLELTDSTRCLQTRSRNVVLAVNLTRHSARGWNDKALPDDYREISALLRMPVAHVMSLVGAGSETEPAAVNDPRATAMLPPIPRDLTAGAASGAP